EVTVVAGVVIGPAAVIAALLEEKAIQRFQTLLRRRVLGEQRGSRAGQAFDFSAVGRYVQLFIVELGDQQGGVQEVDFGVRTFDRAAQFSQRALVMHGLGELPQLR